MNSILAIALILGGLALLFSAYKLYQQAIASRTWPSASGRYTKVSIARNTSDDIGKQYNINITYEYSVDNATYQSRTITPGKESHEVSEIEALRANDLYPLHGTVMVYYDPENPHRAVLEPGNANSSMAGMALGGALAIAGCVGLLV